MSELFCVEKLYMYTYSFEKLRVWELSRQLAVKIYLLTNNFPVSERFGMISQLRRAMISVCSNIAEGSTRKSPKEQAHFYTISYGSLIEVLNQVIIAHDLSWLSKEILLDIRTDIEFLTSRLNTLRNVVVIRTSKDNN